MNLHSNPGKPYLYKFDLDVNDSLVNPNFLYSSAAAKEDGVTDGLKVDSKECVCDRALALFGFNEKANCLVN